MQYHKKGKALLHNVILEELDLRSNRIGPVGFAGLLACFKDNATLKKIIVGSIKYKNLILNLD
jgi:hypothetical protein